MLRCHGVLLRSFLLILTLLSAPFAVLAEAPANSPAEALLTVAEDFGAARRAWPVSTGFPFPPGAVTDERTLYLEELSGKAPIPVQARALSRWPDGSLRWALLDASLDLETGQKRKFRVRSGAAPQPSAKVAIADSADDVEVDTGTLKFVVPKKKLALLDHIQLEGKETGGGAAVSFTRLAEQREAPGPPASVRVVENGPLRARIEIRGEYTKGLRYIIRLDAFAGQSFVRVLHTFENHRDEPYTSIREIGLDVPLALDEGASYSAGRIGRDPLRGTVGPEGSRIVQIDNETLRHDGQTERDNAAGWIDLYDRNHGVIVAARFLWQEYPQGFALRRSGLTYDMWSPEAPPTIAGMGAAKTHEFVIAFHGAARLRALDMTPLVAPVVAHPDPRWVRDSRALPQAIARSEGTSKFLNGLAKAYARYRVRNQQEEWDDSAQVNCAPGAREVRRRGAYGMWNWGDWNFPNYHDDIKGCDAWGNLEYDLTQVLALGFAAIEDRAFFDAMVVAARHFMDVDGIHYQHEHPNWVGMNHPKNPLHFTFEIGGVDLGHTWNEGLLSYYYLTGDERGREAALGIADYLEKRIRAGGVRGNPRQWGWPQIALAAAYGATLDQRYRAGAEAYARGGMRAHPANASHWKYGILGEALTYVHAQTEDTGLKKEIRAWLSTYAEAARKADVRDPRFFPAIAYVGTLDGDAAAIDAARAATDRMKFGTWGKPLTLAGRIGFRILSLTDAKSPVPPAPVCGQIATPRPAQTARAKANPK